MPELPWNTTLLEGWVARIQAGDSSARDALLRHISGRMERLASQMLKRFPGVRRWEQTEDVLQNALVRLLRALQEVNPVSTRHFLALAATQIRRELIDLARHYYGAQGLGAHHASNPGKDGAGSERQPAPEALDRTREPSRLAAWSEFHEQIGALPQEEREVFELLWYQGLTQVEASALLNISERTLKRRWQAARLRLHAALQGQLPDS